MKAKEPEFNQWMKQQGYEQKVKKLVGEALKISNLTRANVKNAELKAQLVKLTKQMKEQANDGLKHSGVDKIKSKDLWLDAASKLEAKANEQIAAAQAAVDSV